MIKITDFVKWKSYEYSFACRRNEDYENGRYMRGEIKNLKEYGNQEDIRDSVAFMAMSFAELPAALK